MHNIAGVDQSPRRWDRVVSKMRIDMLLAASKIYRGKEVSYYIL
jgi:hypothetical protein